MFFKARLRAAEKKLIPGQQRKVRLWRTVSKNLEEENDEINRIIEGKVEHPDGGFYNEADRNFFINRRFTDDLNASLAAYQEDREKEKAKPILQDGQDKRPVDQTIDLEAEIKRLEQRKRELLKAKKKA